MAEGPTFRPAKPWGWVIWAVQMFLRIDLARRNRLHLEPPSLHLLPPPRLPLYHVQFEQQPVWGDGVPGDELLVEIYGSWLEPT